MTSKKVGGRVFEIVSRLYDDKGQKLLSVNDVIGTLEKYNSIKEWAYIIHDKDFLTLDELREQNNLGTLHVAFNLPDRLNEEQLKEVFNKKCFKRNDHMHVVFSTGTTWLDLDTISKWFKIDKQFIRVKKGKGALLDAVQYLTHEDIKQQDLGKHRYDDTEVISNFDWRDQLTKRTASRLKYGRDISEREKLQLEVLYQGKTLREAREENPLIYNKDLTVLKRNRADYLAYQKPPAFRLNLYICGTGGVGKDLMGRAIARSLFPSYVSDEELIFEIGAENSELEGYDGQPVILWSDSRGKDLVKKWGRENLLSGILEPYPVIQKKQNVKYASTSLINSVNIFTGADSWDNFLHDLVGYYKDNYGNEFHAENTAQAFRRFPLIIPVEQNEFDVMLNRGFMEDTQSWEQYYTYKKVAGSFMSIATHLSAFPDERKVVESKTSKPICEAIDEIKCKSQVSSLPDMSIFDSYGKEIN